jgi:hypothetical protein
VEKSGLQATGIAVTDTIIISTLFVSFRHGRQLPSAGLAVAVQKKTPMIQRELLTQLGLAVVMFLIGALVYVIPDSSVGFVILALALVQFVRVQRAEGWAVIDTSIGGWLVILGVMTLIAPEWGIPLLLITGGIQIVRALDDLGMAINLALVAAVAYSRSAPLWSVGLLLVVAVGKVLFLLRDYLNQGTGGSQTQAV